jgi:tetratricopeptide (TPR) repeat protein
MGYAGIRRRGRWVLPAAAGLLLSACLPDAGQRGRAEAAYAAAAEAYGGERFEEALGYVEESLKIDGKFYQARLLEGKILFFLNRPAEAEKIFSDLRVKYPEYTEARLWYLRCLVLPQGRPAGGDLEKIRSALDRELSFNPSDWRVLHLYALLAGNTGDWERRLSMGRRAENALSDSAKVYLDMALSWHSLGLKDRAALALDKARIVSGGNMSLTRLISRTEELLDGLEAGPEGGRGFDGGAAGEPQHE